MKRAVLALLLALLRVPIAAAQPDGEAVEVWVPAPNGTQLALTARLLRPEGRGPFPAVVLLHGCFGVTAHAAAWAERLRAWGHVVLVPDSYTRRGIPGRCDAPEHLARPSSSARAVDAEAAHAWLVATRAREVRADRVAVLGLGPGGTAVLRAVHNMFERRDSPFRAAVAFYPWCGEPNPLRDLDAPLLILTGTEGPAFMGGLRPVPLCERLAAKREGDRGQPLEVVAYPGAHWSFDWEGADRTDGEERRWLYAPAAAEDAIGRVRAFLARHLDGG